ncbi:MAG TPA: hypothetical protein DIV86_02640 [Alphaproteobacteria bacterium]|mgnify:CR=1 FL=1|nr:hypothetical protein [Alphaproteobacteria bacterium]
MAIDLNMDIGTLVKGLLSKKTKSKNDGVTKGSGIFDNQAVKQSILKIILAICVTVILCFIINYFTANPIIKAKSEFQSNSDINQALEKLEVNIISAQSLLNSNRKKAEIILPLFSDLHGERTIFKQITNLASENYMVIRSINQLSATNKDKPIEHSEVQILLNVSGYYSNYLNFKKQLEKAKPYMKIDSEVLALNQSSETDRGIEISISLTDYAMPKKQYEKLLQNSH